MGLTITGSQVRKYVEEPGVTEVIVPSGVTEILPDAFAGCTKIRKVVLSEGVTRIREHAFEGCRNLRDIYLPSSLKTIGVSAFKGCDKLTRMEIPVFIQNIYHNAMPKCQEVLYGGSLVPIRAERKCWVNDVLKLLRSRDFSVSIPYDLKVKIMWVLLGDYPGDVAVFKAVRRIFTKEFKQVLDDNNQEVLNTVLSRDDLLTKDNIDDFIAYASETNNAEAVLLLLNYKREKVGYEDVFVRLAL